MSNDIYMSEIADVLRNCPIHMLAESDGIGGVYHRRVIVPIQKILDINNVCVGDRIYDGWDGIPTDRAIGDILLGNVFDGPSEYVSGAKDIRGPIPVEDFSSIRVIVGMMVPTDSPNIGCVPMMSFSAYSIREAVIGYRATCSYKNYWLYCTSDGCINKQHNKEVFKTVMGAHPDKHYFYTGYSIEGSSSPDDRMKNMVKRIAKRYCNRA